MKFRHELKHRIGYGDMLCIKSRLLNIAYLDENGCGGEYKIRSLYFDNFYDKALREKIDGVNIRSKYRLRYYNGNTDFIRLEKKSKICGLCNKESARIEYEWAKSIIQGDYSFVHGCENPLIKELYAQSKNELLVPKTLVEYTRTAFVYPAGNVRVTFDYDIRTGLFSTDFLDPQSITVPTSDSPIILEVKWDEFIPSVICDAVGLDVSSGAFSKYAAARMYD